MVCVDLVVALIYSFTMKTIFDYSPTEKELDAILGKGALRESRTEYFELLNQDGAYGDIFRLLVMRGDLQSAELTRQLIRDHEYRLDVGFIDCQDAIHQISNRAQSVASRKLLAA